MPDDARGRSDFIRFISQEVRLDGRIPHVDHSGMKALLRFARNRAMVIDKRKKALTLRLRGMGGVIRAAGDIAVAEGADLIGARHVEQAIKRGRSAEEQVKERFGHYYGGLAGEMSESQERQYSPYNYWNENPDDIKGYE
jgi:ATP-dependent Lon protease